MALAVTPGAGANVATIVRSSEHNQQVQAGGYTVSKTISMTCTTSILAADEVIADTQQLDAAMRFTDGTGSLQSVTVIDKDNQKAAISVVFLCANVSMGTENAAVSISDTNAENILGHVDIVSSDYKTGWTNCSEACIRGASLPLIAVSGTDDIYVAVLNGAGTPTYTATGLFLRLGILQD